MFALGFDVSVSFLFYLIYRGYSNFWNENAIYFIE